MFDTEADLDTVLIVTTNSYINVSNCLVMGRGAALELKTMYPEVAKMAGAIIKNYYEWLPAYGLILLPGNIGLFQVKRHFSSPADIDLIQKSTKMLNDLARSNPRVTYHLNYPGIGNGGLKEDLVYEIIKDLPNNVHVWKKGE